MKNNKLTYSTAVKTVVFILMLITGFITACSGVVSTIILSNDLYLADKTQTKHDIFKNMVSGEIALSYDIGEKEIYKTNKSNLSFDLYNEKGEKVLGNYDGSPNKILFEFTRHIYNSDDTYYPIDSAEDKEYIIKAYIDKDFKIADNYRTVNKVIDTAYSLGYWTLILGVISLIFTICFFIFLMYSAGRKSGHEEIVPGKLIKIPFDLILAAYAVILGACSFGIMDNCRVGSEEIIVSIIISVPLFALFTGCCMNLAKRVKLGKWWKNTIIYIIFKYTYRFLKFIWSWLRTLLRNLPLVWKTGVIATILSIIGICVVAESTCGSNDELIVFAVVKDVIFIALSLYIALVLRKLQKGGEALSKGDLSYKVDTKKMFWDFKQHGENLNSIADGMSKAVDEQLKSERLKTELITNVSHDIKTPLTSIINYADLIGKEETDNEKITEYSNILLNQSTRLKYLVENLVEASKASTGNVDVTLVPCELGVLITQTVGEYKQRLKDNNLELIAKQPDTSLKVMADGKLLGRVFDNLMNNINKYSLGGTRVYLSVEEIDENAVITFKNISKTPLDITSNELMERFVRGDSSRNTEGNGLGLSISQSLTELQNGKLNLTVDGDLFKVTIKFKKI